ncbi:MAG TPA: glycoside hydrolase family 2 TIM barrel-domain containing protein, partial [Armatimonadota bacterium]|nr:glycoside hydrolase family 2 TIM barrel-domain containing protein [Armatimonadota bacterium]
MRRSLVVGLLAWVVAGSVAPAAPARETISLDGTWRFCIDENRIGLHRQWHVRAPQTQPIRVPSCWEEYPQWAHYDGVAWYFRTIAVGPRRGAERIALRFEAVNYRAEVYLDGTFAGRHEGGYTPFEVDLTQALQTPPRRDEGYLLAVRVLDPPDQGRADGIGLADVPHGREHLGANFGGIWQPVSLIKTPAARIADVFVQPHLQPRRLEARVRYEGPTAGLRVVHTVLALNSEDPLVVSRPVTPDDSPVWLELPASVRLWRPEDPALYRLRTTLTDGGGSEVDRVETRFGVRQFEVRDGHFVLNGERTALRMIALECVYPLSLVRPPSMGFVEQDLGSVRSLGFNAVRVMGRPAPADLVDAADRLGVLVEEEAPLSQIDDAERASEQYRREVSELVSRDRNHPSVVWWSLMRGVPDDHALLGGLAALVRSLDPSRFVLGNRGPGEAALLWSPGRTDPLLAVDARVRLSAPLSRDELARLSDLHPPGHDGVVLVSEIGYGGLPDFREVAQRYDKALRGRDVADADHSVVVALGRDIDRLLGGFPFRLPGPTGLVSAARRVDHFYVESQRAQADVLSRAVGALRASAEVDGFCIRQWDEDARTAGQGLASLFRQQKAACTVLKGALAPRAAFVLADTPTVVRTQRATATVALVNDTAAGAPCHVRLWAVSPTNESRTLADESVTVLAWGRAALHGSFEPYESGRWRIRAETRLE